VEVWYDGAGEQYFKGGWSQFAEDHDLHQGFFMTFDFHIGTSKFDVRIYDGTQLFFLVLSVINNRIWIMCLLIDHGNESWF
jgi:hypothetical protein